MQHSLPLLQNLNDARRLIAHCHHALQPEDCNRPSHTHTKCAHTRAFIQRVSASTVRTPAQGALAWPMLTTGTRHVEPGGRGGGGGGGGQSVPATRRAPELGWTARMAFAHDKATGEHTHSALQASSGVCVGSRMQHCTQTKNSKPCTQAMIRAAQMKARQKEDRIHTSMHTAVSAPTRRHAVLQCRGREAQRCFGDGVSDFDTTRECKWVASASRMAHAHTVSGNDHFWHLHTSHHSCNRTLPQPHTKHTHTHTHTHAHKEARPQCTCC
jgi:hypothetical protein